MQNTIILICVLWIALGSCFGQPSSAQELTQLTADARAALKKGILFYRTLATEGGYVYHYSLDLQERWGEGKVDDRTVEVQPPGTPAVGMAFLRAYEVTREPEFLQAAVAASQALISGQNELGGWEHKIYFDRPMGKKVSFDDDQSQSAISFLMALGRHTHLPELTAAIDRALKMMLAAQLPGGGWPHQYPAQGNYHDYATFNDEGINDCIRVMLQAHRQYGHPEYLESLQRVGRFLLISQLPPPQPGWAQQYNEYNQPAWARSFEPPALCPSVTLNNIESLMDLYLYTGTGAYLEAIPDALRWLEGSRLPHGKWGRFLEIYTNQALYYDRGRIRKNSLQDLSLERRTGYGYEVDLTDRLASAKSRYEKLQKASPDHFPAVLNDPPPNEEERKKRAEIARQIIDSQDAQGRWISRQDKFRKQMPTTQWNGEYRTEDRLSSALFIQQVEALCQFLELGGG